MQSALSYMDSVNDLSQLLLKKGITLVGFADVSKGLAKEFRHIPKAISLAISHPPNKIKPKFWSDFYQYQYEEVDRALEAVQKQIVNYCKMNGWKALAIPPDSFKTDSRFVARLYPLFPHKTAATCAGLGWIGKNGLLVNKNYGPRLSWATVLTDADLTVSDTPFLQGHCGNCRKCIDACPSGAIKDQEWARGAHNVCHIDIHACQRQLEDNESKYGRAVCGLCILACPRGALSRRG
ncbi:MAG: 4Fe-4S binding protein [Firmicutes bacterium]|nr:4Fe-4S binding protein [Bacillota bacterium]